MIEVSGRSLEVKEIFRELMSSPEKMFEMLDLDLKQIASGTISELLKAELTTFLGRAIYGRGNDGEEKNHRNGRYVRGYAVKGVGKIYVEVPRDRLGKYESSLIRKYEKHDQRIGQDLALMFLTGMSTRNIGLISKKLLGIKVSAGEVSNVSKELLTGIDVWRSKPLHDLKIKYMYIDGVFFSCRVKRSISKVPVLVIIGVTEDNKKIFLAIQQGDKESSTTWRETFKDLKVRGLDFSRVQLGVMDGLPGLMSVFKEEFSNARVQRCQVHVARNVLCKVPKTAKKEVADSLRDVFYASSKKLAKENYNNFVTKYNNLYPSAVKSLSTVLEECLTFFSFPDEDWRSLRTSNLIERVNKEFKRRTKPMEIMAGEASMYRILGFVCLKIEATWKTFPYRKSLDDQDLEKFTQLA